MKKNLVLMIVFIVFLGSKATAQKEEELFAKGFPKLGNELKCSEDRTTLTDQEVADFRAQLKRLSDAEDDIVAYEVGALTDENYKVFTNKELKKTDLEKLKKLINDKRFKIIAYMGTLTKYGADDIECKKNIGLFKQSIKMKDYESAYGYWNYLFHYYPMSTKSIYKDANKVIGYKFNQAKTQEEKDLWIDTLMMAYDQRIKYFGNDPKYPKGYILGKKGRDLYKFKKSALEEAYGYLQESIKLQGVKSEDNVLYDFMRMTDEMYKKGKVDADVFVDNYSLVSDLLAKRLASVSKKEKTQKAIDAVDLIFSKSDAASCDKIVAAYEQKFKADPNNLELLEKIAGILDDKECTDSQLFFDVAVKLNELKPSAFSSYSIANMSLKKEEYGKADEFLRKAIELETNDSLKAKYYFKLAQVADQTGKKVQARTYAQKAIALRGNYGAPYMLIATLYAASGCKSLTEPEGELARISYWVAVDKLIQAKKVDPSIASQANKLIAQYSKNFPNKEDAFFLGITNGSKVTVGCWINERTTARFK